MKVVGSLLFMSLFRKFVKIHTLLVPVVRFPTWWTAVGWHVGVASAEIWVPICSNVLAYGFGDLVPKVLRKEWHSLSGLMRRTFGG
jgi:hypothetical protein